MSELINTKNGRNDMRRQLLMGVSVLTLVASLSAASDAKAGDTDRPIIWIELGAQLEQVSGFGDPFNPPFSSEIVADGFQSPLKLQHALGQSFGGTSKISFQPENSDFTFSASVQYGRAAGRKSIHQQTPFGPRHISFATSSGVNHTFNVTPFNSIVRFADTHISNSETHTLLDFQVGSDIGLGLFNGGQSAVGFGVRVAQFSSKQILNMNADPDFFFPVDPLHNAKYHHTYSVAAHAERSFRGLGPALSWNASAPVLGNADSGGISLNWGANAAVLFGRQRAHAQHQTTGIFYRTKSRAKYPSVPIHHSGDADRSRTVIVPNLGGFGGVSFNFPSAKVSLGYRVDFFFGAMDTGIDVAKRATTGFYGPFASISVGLGG